MRANVAKFRPIFEAFRDLNLLTLMMNLRVHGGCARGAFVEISPDLGLFNRMCPIQHGLPKVCGCPEDLCAYYFSADLEGLVAYFTNGWDYGHIRKRDLLELIESVWHERQEDVDAMQEILTGEPGAVPRAEIALV